MSLLKRAMKQVYNLTLGGKTHTEMFGSFEDVKVCPQVLFQKATLEVMCHPDLDRNGVLVDRDGNAPYDAPFGIPMGIQVSCLRERN